MLIFCVVQKVCTLFSKRFKKFRIVIFDSQTHEISTRWFLPYLPMTEEELGTGRSTGLLADLFSKTEAFCHGEGRCDVKDGWTFSHLLTLYVAMSPWDDPIHTPLWFHEEKTQSIIHNIYYALNTVVSERTFSIFLQGMWDFVWIMRPTRLSLFISRQVFNFFLWD